MKNADQPAFPQTYETDAARLKVVKAGGEPKGLSKREYFAAMVLQGLVSDFDPQSKVNGCFIPATDYPELTKNSVQLADELLKQLEVSNGDRSLPKVLESESKLKAAAKKWISAYDQVGYFLEGYKKGSASIAEVDHARQEEYKAYSEMFDLIKQ